MISVLVNIEIRIMRQILSKIIQIICAYKECEQFVSYFTGIKAKENWYCSENCAEKDILNIEQKGKEGDNQNNNSRSKSKSPSKISGKNTSNSNDSDIDDNFGYDPMTDF